METPHAAAPAVGLSANSLNIQGKPEILLCASLFYFRIPRAYWRERMEQLKTFGYNCIDVYFPWNFHEPREGEWDFAGEKDIEAFLQTAAEAGVWVVARPGPYICSEWDGGALPAYLFAKEGMKLRDQDSAFLAYVSKWYDRVLPMLKKYEAGAGGTVICVQLDNELDFYGCSDPNGYISALRDMALAHGIAVPLIACAGQGGLREASGFAEGVVPTCNFYPNDRDPAFEEKAMHYRELLAERGVPLLVTETNRSHFLLRRLLSCGAKLLGPYLQVSGTNFGFTNATNNWGEPLAFLTSDYDFGGMISPEGHIRAEAYEGRLLSRIIRAYGASLAEAEPDGNVAGTAAAKDGSVVGPRALRLKDGGYLLFVANVGTQAAEVSLDIVGNRIPKLLLKQGRSLALPYGVPLGTWGLEGTLLYASAELFFVRRQQGKTVLAFHTERAGEVAFRLERPAVLKADNASAEVDGGVVTVKFDAGAAASCAIELRGGHTLEIHTMDRSSALLLEDVGEDGAARFGQSEVYDTEPVDLPIAWRFGSVDPGEPMTAERTEVAAAEHLEKFGIYRGFAWYEAKEGRAFATKRQGILIRRGSDIVSLYIGKQYVTTLVPGGSSRYVPTSQENEDDRLLARVEIWGHTNFDDIRLPGLRMNATKGIEGLVSVRGVRDLSQHWRIRSAPDRSTPNEPFVSTSTDDREWPIVGFGGWLSPNRPAFEYFRKSFEPSAEADSWTLHFEGTQADGILYVNGHKAGRIDAADPYIDITSFVVPGARVQLAVFLEKSAGTAVGRVLLYEGVSAKDWRISSCEEEMLLAHAAATRNTAAAADLPVALQAGEMAWLLGELRGSNDGKGWRVRASGTNVKLTVFLNERLVGRLWLPGSAARPRFTGGSPVSFYLPGAWFEEDGARLAVLLEAVEGEQGCRVDGFSFVPV
ncbi:beta-galactosidase [Paenibacillus sp.]|uniref:beta-galactosidase n=1 Tax=Paenibacillus sp. TaxID=58172 RepID=UPI002D637FFE|nr:beta-galactosidase [Paenibacillus sp.]HZG85981.1 beta-galactosidase [Paenibacillus sp.]